MSATHINVVGINSVSKTLQLCAFRFVGLHTWVMDVDRLALDYKIKNFHKTF